MLGSNRKIFLNLMRLTAGVAAIAPLKALAADPGEGMLSHLTTDTIIISILLSNTILLFAFLIRLQQMRAGHLNGHIILPITSMEMRWIVFIVKHSNNNTKKPTNFRHAFSHYKIK